MSEQIEQDGALILALESPLTDDLELLFQRHTLDMHADTPPESIHMMPREDLVHPDIAFFVLRDGGRAVGMGAIKRLGPDHGEVKSMHVLIEERGRGLARIVVERMIDHARRSGFARLSLETGSQPMFLPARKLYERVGFVECGPFGSYRLDPNSVYMTLSLSRAA
ncbi:GNAT family N-acetyltransferase [Paracoccus aestuariivivens]|uniref:GNAT family N-acetyltransferase n=1 Tax=Paracoccus aestuariivivens TaxID=1820333 RepID=A0A6L6JDS4_9RHOB|nr:GNAT family N-acetyltransferase [Paracoccus aestuariivivens]MTH78879.1 GNAT family N-acetyltransferase [Paracoccus aestuariivivens]